MGVNDAREQLEVCKDEYGKLERELAEVKSERDALAAQIAATKQVVSYFADEIEPHVYGEISCELDDDLLDDDGKTVVSAALAKVKADAWSEGHAQAMHNVAWPKERKGNPYRTEPR